MINKISPPKSSCISSLTDLKEQQANKSRYAISLIDELGVDRPWLQACSNSDHGRNRRQAQSRPCRAAAIATMPGVDLDLPAAKETTVLPVSAQWKPGYHGPACQGPQHWSENFAKDQALQAWRASPSPASLAEGFFLGEGPLLERAPS